MNTPKLLTRRQVIEAWNKSEKYLDYYVCPCCRDIMRKIDDTKYACHNHTCSNDGIIVDIEEAVK